MLLTSSRLDGSRRMMTMIMTTITIRTIRILLGRVMVGFLCRR
jgi:hypothetical protein